MNYRRSAAIALNDFRLLRRDIVPYLTMTIAAIVLIAFFRRPLRLLEEMSGSVSSKEQAVIGLSVMFSMFLVGTTGFAVFREHGWQTWDRLRVVASHTDIMIAKAVVPFVVVLAHFALILGLSHFLYGVELRGSAIAVIAVVVSFSACLVAMSFAVIAFCHSVMQVNAISSLGAVILAGLGGAMIPTSVMPDWTVHIAPALPTYWAINGLRAGLEGTTSGDALESCAVLALFTVAFLALSRLRFHATDTKVSFV